MTVVVRLATACTLAATAPPKRNGSVARCGDHLAGMR
jgi:hypothetical protein